ncbi:efflux transporter outer membrane subunit [Frigoriflavimonas asaccharolytica]|uniref:NodT family efflux transporter outer membrane factor (OMF) lipoprotein n=1 Tax=Frigoriflavimonas asaccharolytica TaxID=2735899 RepID=A0A8J8K5B7_9FLAO|nr:efflux transporter outer membrane subunit [Frigoriflavimonas asaccharolytica]NRS92640.1 NodT family efflux transporter outer membrane factor (OMF) lipoprotein [Frigoriflavimonas asaccharolytica]
MKLNFNIKYIALFVTASFTLASCMTRTKYERPEDINENVFRTDNLPKDSSTIASISYKEFFTDKILQKHLDVALQNNLDVRIAVQNIVSSEAYLKQSKAAFLPTVSAGPDYTFQTQSLNTQFGQIFGERRYINQYDITANFSWEADIWGKLNAQEKAQFAGYMSTVAAHQRIKSELVANIANNYYQLLTFDEQKRIINETIILRNKNLETTKALKIAGILTEVAVQQSEALVFNAQALLVDIDVQIEILENSTSVLMGISPQKIERSSSKSQVFPSNISTGYSSQLLANRPDVFQAEYQLKQKLELTNAARAAFYPSFKITASSGVQGIELDKLFSVNSLFANVAAGLTQPILNKRLIKTAYEVSLADKQIAYLNFKKTYLQAGEEVSSALKRYQSQEEFLNFKIKEKNAYQKSVDDSQQLVNYGLANYLEVLNSSERLLTAELNISNAEFIKMKANIDLYKALGGGWK